jgi:peptidoglycan hydrolase-like protein with peptidoglycan-binding domain|tara:strand:- start:1566 stop:2462 length:897 start_codon:yes stop_codon:yes gene_type:complete
MNKDFYNKSSATQLGWDPTWFGEKYYDDKLVRAIKKFQKQYDLTADGLCGPSTFRRIWTERQADIDDFRPVNRKYSNYLVYNSNFIPIEWDKVVLWSEEGGLSAKPGNYYDYTGRAKRNIRLFVNHWDVCLDSTRCNDVLNKRGISVHFLIDNDGTIFQTLDMQHGAWHGSSGRVNRASVGVEISNAYYPKYQNWYEKRGFGERPTMNGVVVHGQKLPEFLGFYDVQIQAAQALWKAIESTTAVEYKTPLDNNGNTSTKYEQDVVYGKFAGIVSHYHCSKKKIDCGGMDIKALIEEIK